MGEFSVKSIDSIEQKGLAELEAELIKKTEDEHEEAVIAAVFEPAPNEEIQKAPEEELTEEKVLSFIEKRYNKQVNSFDELLAEKKANEDLPEDVAAYLKFKNETGRGFEDFVKVNRDLEKADPDQILKEHLLLTQPELDESDVEVLMEQYRYDEELDSDSDIKRAKIARKKAIAEAKNYFNSEKDKYKVPLESRGPSLSEEERKEYEAYREYTQEAKAGQEVAEKKRKWFDQKTSDVFGKDFKGFEFDIDGKKIYFTPGSAEEVRKANENTNGFISKFLDGDGLLSDAVGYHKALAGAMNLEKFASFFYEQGKSAATNDGLQKDIKNINMSERKTPEGSAKGGIQVRAVSQDSGRGLKIGKTNF